MTSTTDEPLTAATAEQQWDAGWVLIASAAEQALANLHPQHPHRDDWLDLVRDAREAAGLPVTA